MHLHLQEGQIGIFQEVFSQEQEREETLGNKATVRVPKKVCFEKHCNLCKKHGGTYTTHNTCDRRRFEKIGKEKSDFCATKKGVKKDNPVNQNFVQLTKKIEKLEKVLKKSDKKGQKRRCEDSNSDSE